MNHLNGSSVHLPGAFMKTALIRLDGILVPPIWQQIAVVAGIPELIAKQETLARNAEVLMLQRLAALRKHRLSMDDLLFIVSMHEPFSGAAAFVQALRKSDYRIIVVSDALPELARHFATLLGDVGLHTDGSFPEGNWSWLWKDDTVLIGQTASDVIHLRQSKIRFLFRPSQHTLSLANGIAVAQHYREILNEVDALGHLEQSDSVEIARVLAGTPRFAAQVTALRITTSPWLQ